MARVMLPRLLSRWGIASRKQAEAWVHAGRVAVDGTPVRDVTAWVSERARITLDGAPVGPSGQQPTWLALHKPRGVLTTTSDPEGRATVMPLVAAWPVPGLAPVGRLDQASQGLLLFTDDHATAARLLDPEHHVRKRYRVKVAGHLGDAALRTLREDTLVDEGLRLGPMEVEVELLQPASSWLIVQLTEGRNRQIRRRLEAVGHPVETLVRTDFGPVALGALRPGEARALTAAEVQAIRGSAAGSSPPRAAPRR